MQSQILSWTGTIFTVVIAIATLIFFCWCIYELIKTGIEMYRIDKEHEKRMNKIFEENDFWK